MDLVSHDSICFPTEGRDLPERERLCNLADFSTVPAGVPVLSRGEADDDVEASCCWDDSIFLEMRCLAEPVTAMFFLFEVAGIVSRCWKNGQQNRLVDRREEESGSTGRKRRRLVLI